MTFREPVSEPIPSRAFVFSSSFSFFFFLFRVFRSVRRNFWCRGSTMLTVDSGRDCGPCYFGREAGGDG